jgi:hypothetical protein
MAIPRHVDTLMAIPRHVEVGVSCYVVNCELVLPGQDGAF